MTERKNTKRHVAGAVLAAGTLVGVYQCRQPNAAIQPTHSNVSSILMSKDHYSRMQDDLKAIEAKYENIHDETLLWQKESETSTYLLAEIERAAATKARGLLEEGDSSLYYEFPARMKAIGRVLNEQKQGLRTAVVVRMNAMLNNLNSELNADHHYTYQIFSKAFDSTELARDFLTKAKRQSDPDMDPVVMAKNEMISAYEVMSKEFPAKRR